MLIAGALADPCPDGFRAAFAGLQLSSVYKGKLQISDTVGPLDSHFPAYTQESCTQRLTVWEQPRVLTHVFSGEHTEGGMRSGSGG